MQTLNPATTQDVGTGGLGPVATARILKYSSNIILFRSIHRSRQPNWGNHSTAQHACLACLGLRPSLRFIHCQPHLSSLRTRLRCLHFPPAPLFCSSFVSRAASPLRPFSRRSGIRSSIHGAPPALHSLLAGPDVLEILPGVCFLLFTGVQIPSSLHQCVE